MKNLKFKYFFNENGTPGEEEINKWLEDKNIEVISLNQQGGCLSVFYIENKK